MPIDPSTIRSNSYLTQNFDKKEDTTEEKRVVTPVVSNPTTIEKKGVVKKFIKDMLPENIPQTKDDIRKKVIVPAIKRTIMDVIGSFLGEPAAKTASNISSRISYLSNGSTNYNAMSKNKTTISGGGSTAFDYDSICYSSAADAQAVLNAMNDILLRYKVVRVSDLYELSNCGLPPYTAHKYGWASLAGSQVTVGRDGYFLNLPNVMPID